MGRSLSRPLQPHAPSCERGLSLRALSLFYIYGTALEPELLELLASSAYLQLSRSLFREAYGATDR